MFWGSVFFLKQTTKHYSFHVFYWTKRKPPPTAFAASSQGSLAQGSLALKRRSTVEGPFPSDEQSSGTRIEQKAGMNASFRGTVRGRVQPRWVFGRGKWLRSSKNSLGLGTSGDFLRFWPFWNLFFIFSWVLKQIQDTKLNPARKV